MKSSRIAAGLAAIAMSMSFAACGSDSDSSDGPKAGSVGAQTGQAAATAKEKGTADAKAKATLPKRTIGFIQFTNEAEIAVRAQDATKAAGKAIGWNVITCDGQGDPRKQGACGSTLLDRGADVIIANSIAPSVAKRAMRTAKSKGVPWIVVAGVVDPDPLMTANYPPDDAAMGKALGDWMVKALGSGDKKIAVVNRFQGLKGYQIRYDGLKSALSAAPSDKIVAEEDVDYANLVEDVRRDVGSVLSSNPDVDAIYSISNDIPPIVSALRSERKTADDGPMVVGFFGDQANLDAIRAGTADAVAEWPVEADIWAAVDQVAGSLSRKDPIATTLKGAYSLPFSVASVVDKSNLPAKGQYPAPKADFVTYFKTKWAAEYGSAAAR